MMKTTGYEQSLIDQSGFLQAAAFNLTRDKEAAKDLVQQTLLLALKNEQVFASGTNLKAWLFTILRNSFISDYQKKQRRLAIIRQHPPSLWAPATEDNTAPGKMQLDKIVSLVYTLPTIYHRVLSLRINGYRYTEISAITGEPVGTIKSRVHIARRLLREKLHTVC